MPEEKGPVGRVEFSNISDSEITIGSIVTSQTAGGDIVGGNKITNIYQSQPLLPAEIRARADLNILLKNVETSWIKGVLEKSVHQAVLLDLGKEVRTEAIEHPWETVIGRPSQADQYLPAGTKISAIFEEMPLLLILGEPGSGKTITLLELARELIAKVRVDSTFAQPIPVVVNLSTWTNKQQALNDWVIEELRSKYQTPKQLGRAWLEQRRILPLLDGLDEVKAENRAACVEAINQFAVDYGLQGLVVCSRLKDYLQLPVRLKFYGAIYLRPLDEQQIGQYLAKTGDKLKSLRELLQQDETLRTLAQSPLMLNIMSLAYQEKPIEEQPNQSLKTLEGRRRELFDTYIHQMFKRRGKDRAYSEEKTKVWLCWLARNMRQHNQELFLIEGLQPSWLQSRGWRWTYILASRLIGGLIFGLSFELIAGLITWLILGLTYGLIAALINELLGGLIVGLIGGFIVGFIDVLRFEWLGKRVEIRNLSTFWWPTINVIVVGLIFGLISGLSWGLSYALIVGLRGSYRSLANDVQTIELLRWSWRKAIEGGLIFGLLGGLIFGLLGGLTGGLILGLIFGLLGGLIVTIFNGLRYEIVETKTAPNQGIRLSIRNAVFGGLIVGLTAGLIYGLILGLLVGLLGGLISALADGLSYGLIGSLWYGGLDVIQHYTLRLILIIQGYTPYNYAHFLDYAVERIFLQKVGGGYRFIHRLLLEHFAAMGQEEVKNDKNPVPKSQPIQGA